MESSEAEVCPGFQSSDISCPSIASKVFEAGISILNANRARRFWISRQPAELAVMSCLFYEIAI